MELPKVFRNSISKKIENNKSVFYSNRGELDKVDISKKINDIFTSPNYVYKAVVNIRLKDKIITKTLVGKNKDYLMTLDNELIPIKDIIDINKKTT